MVGLNATTWGGVSYGEEGSRAIFLVYAQAAAKMASEDAGLMTGRHIEASGGLRLM